MTKPRVLHCITAYNGRHIVPRALKSAMEMDRSVLDIDVLILDDCSPDIQFSAETKVLCDQIGAHYYRSPRNLGIPRNNNVGLLTALKGGYDYVTINNSDVIFGKYALTELYIALQNNDNVASVTAWSNNVSIYSIPNADPDLHLGSQEAVNWLADTARELNSGKVIDIPAGISFCIMIPTPIVERVGVFDPVYGRGYCEETDWSLRSLAMGYRCCLAPGAFTYHQGGGSNISAGLVSAGHTTVPENEAIVDLRYPNFRDEVDDFFRANPMPGLYDALRRGVIEKAIAERGYEIDVSWMPLTDKTGHHVTLTIAPEGDHVIAKVDFLGFGDSISLQGPNYIAELTQRFGMPPVGLNMYDRGRVFDALSAGMKGGAVSLRRTYPSLV